MKYFAGWGTLLEQCFDELCERIGQTPDFICDNSTGKLGRTLRGIPCISIDATKDDPEAEFFITIRKHQELANQIMDLGHHQIHVAHFDRAYHKLTRLSPYEISDQSPSPFPTDFFRDKHVLVTGASRGLGAHLAVTLAAHGANLLLHARDVGHLSETLARCQAYGRCVTPVAANLEHPQEIEGLIQQAMSAAPQIDILYNNAGISPALPSYLFHISPLDFERCFKINALAPILIANALIPGMLSRGFGRIVNVSTALQFQPLSAAYAISKAALDKFVSDLAPTLDNTGVAINLIDPGSLSTDMNPTGPYPANSATHGLLLAALYAHSNGRWFSAQDYSALTLDEAHAEAIHRLWRPEL